MTDHVQFQGRKVAHRVLRYWYPMWGRWFATTVCGLEFCQMDETIILHYDFLPPDVPLCKRCAVAKRTDDGEDRD